MTTITQIIRTDANTPQHTFNLPRLSALFFSATLLISCGGGGGGGDGTPTTPVEPNDPTPNPTPGPSADPSLEDKLNALSMTPVDPSDLPLAKSVLIEAGYDVISGGTLYSNADYYVADEAHLLDKLELQALANDALENWNALPEQHRKNYSYQTSTFSNVGCFGQFNVAKFDNGNAAAWATEKYARSCDTNNTITEYERKINGDIRPPTMPEVFQQCFDVLSQEETGYGRPDFDADAPADHTLLTPDVLFVVINERDLISECIRIESMFVDEDGVGISFDWIALPADSTQ